MTHLSMLHFVHLCNFVVEIRAVTKKFANPLEEYSTNTIKHYLP
jgi:hypothetical protein